MSQALLTQHPKDLAGPDCTRTVFGPSQCMPRTFDLVLSNLSDTSHGHILNLKIKRKKLVIKICFKKKKSIF